MAGELPQLRPGWDVARRLPEARLVLPGGRGWIARPLAPAFVLHGLILVGTVLFVVFEAPFLATEVSAATVVIPLVLVVFADASAWATSIRDPGILPRSAWVPPEVAGDPDAMAAVHNYKNYRKTVYRAVAVNGATVAVKFCYTCCIYVPPRANHCSECDACIERFDHHCPWMSNCIGRRNYRHYVAFLVTTTTAIALVMALCITHLVLLTRMLWAGDTGAAISAAMRASPVSMILIILLALAAIPVVTLGFMHLHLTATGQTTNEYMKIDAERRGIAISNPYDRGGVVRNCTHLFCAPAPPSFLRLAWADEGIRPDSAPPILRNIASNPVQQQHGPAADAGADAGAAVVPL